MTRKEPHRIAIMVESSVILDAAQRLEPKQTPGDLPRVMTQQELNVINAATQLFRASVNATPNKKSADSVRLLTATHFSPIPNSVKMAARTLEVATATLLRSRDGRAPGDPPRKKGSVKPKPRKYNEDGVTEDLE